MFIKKTKLVSKSIHSSLEIDILASDSSELQIQVEKSEWEDYFFDLSIEQAIALRDGLNLFINGRVS
jgi:hypothetical protein